MSVTVAAFPRSLRGNPYCDLLYRGVTAMGTRLAEPADFSPGWVFRNRRSVDVLHIHWPELYYRGRGGRVTLRSAAGFVGTLVLARALGYRIVWTVHNALPHDGHRRADRLLRWALVRMARLVVHAESARQVLPRSARRAIVVPHGHYIDAYPHDLDETAARRGLGLAAGDRVLLCFGQLRAYKGVPELLAAFAQVTQPGLRLVVAGRPVDPAIAEMVTAAAASDPRIIAHLVHVDDADVQLYFEAADWVVLPYREVLTSGSALLALSFARPVVAPRQGCLAELGPADGVLAYEPDRPHALATALAEAAATDARPWRARALATAERSDWDTIARAYDRIFAGG